MEFEKVIEHLGKRGFATRERWNGKCAVCFGMDNVGFYTYQDRRPIHNWVPCLADISSDDWVILPFYWEGSKDNYLPYDEE